MTITSATLGQERCYSSCSEWEGGCEPRAAFQRLDWTNSLAVCDPLFGDEYRATRRIEGNGPLLTDRSGTPNRWRPLIASRYPFSRLQIV